MEADEAGTLERLLNDMDQDSELSQLSSSQFTSTFELWSYFLGLFYERTSYDHI